MQNAFSNAISIIIIIITLADNIKHARHAGSLKLLLIIQKFYDQRTFQNFTIDHLQLRHSYSCCPPCCRAKLKCEILKCQQM